MTEGIDKLKKDLAIFASDVQVRTVIEDLAAGLSSAHFHVDPELVESIEPSVKEFMKIRKVGERQEER